MRALLAALALCAAGCPAGLEEQQHISKLRVLGIRADPPELVLEPDAGLPATHLTALGVAPPDTTAEVDFALCADLSGVPSPTLDCPGDAGLPLPEGRLDLSDPRILSLAASLQLNAGSIDAGAIEAQLDKGVPLLVGFTVSAGAEKLSGFQTITLRTAARGPPNQNPVLLDLEIGDGGTVQPGETVRLQPDTGPKQAASVRYLYSFFSTAGSISSFHSTDTTSTGQTAPTWVDWTAPPEAQPVHLWVVVRDGRGGIDWMERTVTVK
jgi:hypothetical protein